MRKTQRLLRSCAAMAAASSFGWGQGPTQKSDQSDWSAWSRLPDDPQLAYRVRQDASLKDGYGTAHFIQFKNNGSSAANCEVAVHYTFSKGVPIGPCTYTAIVSLAPTEQSAEKSIGTLEAIQSVSFLKDGLPQGHAAAPDSPPAFTQASVKTVAQDAADKQAQIDQLVQQTSDDAKKIADANAKLAEKEAKDKARFQARQQVLDGLATQILSAKGINPAGPGLATTPTFAPPTFGTPGFGAPTLGGFPSAFGPGAIPILPSSKSLFGSYNLIMRQFSSGAAQYAPYFDLAKALTAGNASQSALLEKVQAGASIVSSVSGLLSHHSKSKDKAAMNAETEKNLKVIQKNYEQAKAQADPTIDGLVDKVYSEDFTGINEVMRGAAKDDRTKLVNRQASNGDTPIHAAASEGNLTLIRYFHDLGANLDALDPEGRTPLYRATQFHQADAAMLLLSYKADAKLKPLPQLSGVPPKTPAELAKADKDSRTLMVLEGRTQMVAAQPDKSGLIALAATGDAPQLAQAAQDNNPDVRDAFGWTPLHYAVAMNQLDAIQALADCGADMNAQTLTGRNPLTLAVEKDQPFAVLALIRNGADPAAKDASGDDPLTLARSLDRKEIVELLSKSQG